MATENDTKLSDSLTDLLSGYCALANLYHDASRGPESPVLTLLELLNRRFSDVLDSFDNRGVSELPHGQ